MQEKKKVRAQTLGLYIPDSGRAWLLSGAPRIYDRKDLDLPGNRQLRPSLLPFPRTVYAGFEPGPVKGKASSQATMGMGKGPAKGSKGDDSTLAQDPPFFTVAQQKGKDTAPKGGKKKDKGGHKDKGKGNGKDQKGWPNQIATI